MARTKARPFSAQAGRPAAGVTGKPVVAIVGRPNVGKSTLFNRLIGGRHAIVEDIAGTTRDRLYGEAELGRASFVVIDTGGLEPAAEEGYPALIRRQVETALAEADVVLFLVDAVSGCTVADQEIAQQLRRAEKPVLLLANKADNDTRRAAAAEFYELALGDPIAVSAYHDIGLGELRDRLEELLPPAEAEAEAETLRLAIVGRPNVGKSALVNAILGQERVLVSAEPGTTRDAVDTPFDYGGKRLVLIDTAGIRRRGRVSRGVEKYSVMRAEQALARADIGLLVLDASEGLAAQDLHIAGYVTDAYKGLIAVVNKWDLMEDTEENREVFAESVLRRLRFAPWAPLAFVSAKTGLNVEGLLDLALEALRILYVTQAEVKPPTFVFFVSDASLLHFSYQRYLENALRRAFGFEGTAIRLVFRSRGGE